MRALSFLCKLNEAYCIRMDANYDLAENACILPIYNIYKCSINQDINDINYPNATTSIRNHTDVRPEYSYPYKFPRVYMIQICKYNKNAINKLLYIKKCLLYLQRYLLLYHYGNKR